MFELPTFPHLVRCIVGDGKDTFPWFYHLSSLKNCPISDFLVWFANFVSFSFRFRRHLSNRKTTEVASFLSLLKESSFRAGRRDICVWSGDLVEGLSCKSFFRLLLDPTLVGELVFDVVWRIKIP